MSLTVPNFIAGAIAADTMAGLCFDECSAVQTCGPRVPRRSVETILRSPAQSGKGRGHSLLHLGTWNGSKEGSAFQCTGREIMGEQSVRVWIRVMSKEWWHGMVRSTGAVTHSGRVWLDASKRSHVWPKPHSNAQLQLSPNIQLQSQRS